MLTEQLIAVRERKLMGKRNSTWLLPRMREPLDQFGVIVIITINSLQKSF